MSKGKKLKDISETKEAKVLKSFYFPRYDRTVKAETLEEATQIVEK